ncbi:hypothetical protein ABZ252_02515 [Streptomyces sp. NPDC006175]|uniref:hypothetical protein n=1 Tax=Streptomyces sp. NPDC006175 TaxID=3154471 RepID=UPI00339E6961
MGRGKRNVEELPGDPGRLWLDYRHGHPAQLRAQDDALYEWTVSVAERKRRHKWAASSDTVPGPEIGSFTFVRLHDADPSVALGAAESYGMELANIFLPLVAWDSSIEEALQGVVEKPSGDLLILFRASLDRSWRGFGLGPILASEAIQALAAGCCAVIVSPTMGEKPDDNALVTPEYWAEANAKIAAMWEGVGFRHHAGSSLYLLDPARPEQARIRARLRHDLAALTDAYRSAHRAE